MKCYLFSKPLCVRCGGGCLFNPHVSSARHVSILWKREAEWLGKAPQLTMTAELGFRAHGALCCHAHFVPFRVSAWGWGCMWPGFGMPEASGHFLTRRCSRRGSGGGRLAGNECEWVWVPLSPLESTWKAFWDKGPVQVWREDESWPSSLEVLQDLLLTDGTVFFSTASPASSVSNLIQTASLIVQYLQRGLSLDSAFSTACWEAYVGSQASPANQQVLWGVWHSFLQDSTTGGGRCSAGSNFNGLRELTCSYAGAEIWCPGTFLENSINVIKYALKLASQQKRWNFVMLGIEECVLAVDLEGCRHSTSPVSRGPYTVCFCLPPAYAGSPREACFFAASTGNLGQLPSRLGAVARFSALGALHYRRLSPL